MQPSVITQIGGAFKIEIIRENDHKEVVMDWAPNLFLDTGWVNIQDKAGYMHYAYVGTGSTSPSVTDNILEAQIGPAQKGGGISSYGIGDVSGSDYAYVNLTYTWGVGAIVGNISELGVGPSSGGTNITARMLIVDDVGDPTTITVGATDRLVVSYQLRNFSNPNPSIGIVDVGGTPVAWKLATTGSIYRYNSYTDYGSCWGFVGTGTAASKPHNNIDYYMYCVYGASVALSDAGVWSNITTSSGIHIRDSIGMTGTSILQDNNVHIWQITWTALAGHWNTAGAAGIRGIKNQKLGQHNYQLWFDTPLYKDNTQTFTWAISYGWERYTG